MGRQIMGSNATPNPPISVFSQEEYNQKERYHVPMKVLDASMNCSNHDGTLQASDFSRYTKRDILYGNLPNNNRSQIKPLNLSERRGSHW